jgi:ABC-type Fe3+ transport system permease subunit
MVLSTAVWSEWTNGKTLEGAAMSVMVTIAMGIFVLIVMRIFPQIQKGMQR